MKAPKSKRILVPCELERLVRGLVDVYTMGGDVSDRKFGVRVRMLAAEHRVEVLTGIVEVMQRRLREIDNHIWPAS